MSHVLFRFRKKKRLSLTNACTHRVRKQIVRMKLRKNAFRVEGEPRAFAFRLSFRTIHFKLKVENTIIKVFVSLGRWNSFKMCIRDYVSQRVLTIHFELSTNKEKKSHKYSILHMLAESFIFIYGKKHDYDHNFVWNVCRIGTVSEKKALISDNKLQVEFYVTLNQTHTQSK